MLDRLQEKLKKFRQAFKSAQIGPPGVAEHLLDLLLAIGGELRKLLAQQLTRRLRHFRQERTHGGELADHAMTTATERAVDAERPPFAPREIAIERLGGQPRSFLAGEIDEHRDIA